MKNRLLYSAVAFTVWFLTGCNGKPGADTTATGKNKEIAAKLNDALVKGDTAALNMLVDADVVNHTHAPGFPDKGLAALKAVIIAQHNAFPDLRFFVHNITAEGDFVYVAYNLQGTNTGAAGNMPATNKPINIDGVQIYHIKDGKLTEHWGYFEQLKMMEQLHPQQGANTGGPGNGNTKPQGIQRKKKHNRFR